MPGLYSRVWDTINGNTYYNGNVGINTTQFNANTDGLQIDTNRDKWGIVVMDQVSSFPAIAMKVNANGGGEYNLYNDIAQIGVRLSGVSGTANYIKAGEFSINTTGGSGYMFEVGGDMKAVDLDVSNNIRVANAITHVADSNTYMYFLPDQIGFYAGGVEMLRLDEDVTDAVFINPNQLDINFRVHGNNMNDILRCDAGLDMVTIGGGFGLRTGEITVNTTITSKDTIMLCYNTITVNLPKASTWVDNKTIYLKNRGTNTITLRAFAGETIDGTSTVTLPTHNDCIQIHSHKFVEEGTGYNWMILNRYP